jgi:hypothetical protein
MSEMNGLRSIVNNAGTLHGIEEPPDPLEWRTTAEYEAAYRAWWERVHLWRVSRVPPADEYNSS